MDYGRISKEYSAWRLAVKKRDKGKCMWPDCKRKCKEVHHIIPYSVAIHLRYAVENGICLCLRHHKSVKGKEIAYAGFFMAILKKNKK